MNDNDRSDWLVILNQLAKVRLKQNSCVIVCSALNETYRIMLSNGIEENTNRVYLYGYFEELKDRIIREKIIL